MRLARRLPKSAARLSRARVAPFAASAPHTALLGAARAAAQVMRIRLFATDSSKPADTGAAAGAAGASAGAASEADLKAAMDWIKSAAASGDFKADTSYVQPPGAAAGSVGADGGAPKWERVVDVPVGDATAAAEAESDVGAAPVSRPYKMPEKETKAVPSGSEAKKGTARVHEFKTETKQILDIVTNSLYTDKEVFLRELISNASDAIEKFRYLQQSAAYKPPAGEQDRAMEIHIVIDNAKKTITVQDFGIGMTGDELVSHLGTIARSGSKAYKELAAKSGATPQAATASQIIGQFGVGFYSVFMVGHKVEVWSKSAAHPEQPAHFWTSDGSGAFEMSEADGVERGTKVTVYLKDNYESKAFAQKHVVETIIKKYSNFVGSPIYLNGTKMNTFSAIWAADKSKVTDAEHKEFYRFIANAYDDPTYRLQFSTDVPLNINALFYLPERHMEKFGMGRSDPGVNVYSRKVLIQAKSKLILPDWLRFVKGVVDSEDIPLHISRENMQDSALIARINSVLTKRIIKFLDEQARKEPAKYNKWFKEFGQFIKEGACNDYANKDDVARLLRFDTSIGDANPQSLDEYVSRMPPEQKAIYYLNAPSRQYALSSPYYESFAKKKVEVLFLYQHIDDFVMKNMETFNKRRLVSIESADAALDLQNVNAEAVADKDNADALPKLTPDDEQKMVDFFRSVLADRVSSVKATSRLVNSPAIVVDHESAAVRRVMRFVDGTGQAPMSKQKLEINASHPLLRKLAALRADAQPQSAELSKLLVEQVFDNALIAADILDNPRSMLQRLQRIMDASLASVSAPKPAAAPAAASAEPTIESIAAEAAAAAAAAKRVA